MPIELDSFSRFLETQVIIVDGKETFGSWKEPEFLKRELDEQLEIIKIRVDNTTQGRPDIIANDLYGSPQFFWVLIAFNKPKNPVGWPPTGAVIKAPTSEVVLSNL